MNISRNDLIAILQTFPSSLGARCCLHKSTRGGWSPWARLHLPHPALTPRTALVCLFPQIPLCSFPSSSAGKGTRSQELLTPRCDGSGSSPVPAAPALSQGLPALSQSCPSCPSPVPAALAHCQGWAPALFSSGALEMMGSRNSCASREFLRALHPAVGGRSGLALL